MNTNRPRLCYVLPKFDVDSEEHFFHIYGFLRRLAQSVDLFVIVERSAGRLELPETRVYTQRLGFPLRIVEAFVLLLWARVLGYRRFYVHYSYVGGILASVLGHLTGGTVYYWNCGLAKMFFGSWQPNPASVRAKLTAELPLRLTLRLADHLVTGTPGMADYYARALGVPRARTLVVPNEIDLQRFPIPSDRVAARRELKCEDLDVVLFVHRLSPRKGAEHLPDIVRRVAESIPHVVFLVAGDGPSRQKIEAQLVADGLGAHARFLGWVPNRTIQRLYAAADLYLLPSDEEGFPRVLLEAMACCVPIVATDVGGVREILPPEEFEWLAPAGDTAEIARRVVSLLKSTSVREALKPILREHVRQYDTSVVSERFIRSIVSDSKEAGR